MLCQVDSEAAAESWLTFSAEGNESKARVWVDKEMCGGLAPAHSGYSPRRAVMGNRHIPVQRLPTPYLFSRKEKQEKMLETWTKLGEAEAAAWVLGGFYYKTLTRHQGGGNRGLPGRVS